MLPARRIFQASMREGQKRAQHSLGTQGGGRDWKGGSILDLCLHQDTPTAASCLEGYRLQGKANFRGSSLLRAWLSPQASLDDSHTQWGLSSTAYTAGGGTVRNT